MLDTGVALAETLGERLHQRLVAAVEEVAIPLLDRTRAEREHQVRPVDALHMPEPMQFAQPDEGHTIRCREAAAAERGAQRGIALTFHHPMHARDADILLLAAGNPLIEEGERHLHIDGADTHPQDVDARRPRYHARYRAVRASSSVSATSTRFFVA